MDMSRDPTTAEAMHILERFLERSDPGAMVPAAAKVLLRDYRAQARVAMKLEAIVHEATKHLEEGLLGWEAARQPPAQKEAEA